MATARAPPLCPDRPPARKTGGTLLWVKHTFLPTSIRGQVTLFTVNRIVHGFAWASFLLANFGVFGPVAGQAAQGPPRLSATGSGCWGGVCLPAPSASSAGGSLSAGHPAVARVVVTTGLGRSFGTGTVVAQTGDRAWVLSCAHLFEGRVTGIQVAFPTRGVYAGQLTAIDRTWDLALVMLPAVKAEPVPLATEAPQAGQWLTACGYGPDGRWQCVRGQVRGYVATAQTGSFETLSLNGAARPGDSGGPIFDQSGQLVGVIWGSDGRMIVATYCGRIRAFLNRVLGPLLERPAPSEDPPLGPSLPAPSPKTPEAAEGTSCAPEDLRRELDGLAKRLDRVEVELGLRAGSSGQSKLSDRLLRLEEAAAALPALRQKVAEAEHLLGSDNLRAVIRDVALGLLAEHAPSALERWLPQLLQALGWTGPPSLALVLVGRWLGRLVAQRAATMQRKLRSRSAQAPAAAPAPSDRQGT